MIEDMKGLFKEYLENEEVYKKAPDQNVLNAARSTRKDIIERMKAEKVVLECYVLLQELSPKKSKSKKDAG